MSIVLTTGEQIDRFRLATIRAGVRLEMAGMTRRGRSCTAIAKGILGLPKSTKSDVVLTKLTELLK